MSAKNRRRRIRKHDLEAYVATHAVVGYEEHARVKLELERVSAVLADLLEEQRGAAVPSREVVNWVKNPEAVRELISNPPLTAEGYEYDVMCAGCTASVGAGHYRTCTVAMAWAKLGGSLHELALDHALWDARAEDARRAREQERYRTRGANIPPGATISLRGDRSGGQRRLE